MHAAGGRSRKALPHFMPLGCTNLELGVGLVKAHGSVAGALRALHMIHPVANGPGKALRVRCQQVWALVQNIADADTVTASMLPPTPPYGCWENVTVWARKLTQN